MNSPTTPPPSAAVQRAIAPQLEAMGARVLDDNATGAVEIRLPSTRLVEVANAAFEDSIAGVAVRWADATGAPVRGVASAAQALATIVKLPGVTRYEDDGHTPGDVSVSARNLADVARLDALLKRRIGSSADTLWVEFEANDLRPTTTPRLPPEW